MEKHLFLSLSDDSWQRAHYAFVVAAGALSIGRSVTLFAGGQSVKALAKDWSGLSGYIPDAELALKKVAGFKELRDAVIDLGGELMACQAGVAMTDLLPEMLEREVSIRGVVTFLEKSQNHQIFSL
ncbi:hypothetical protein [Swingsia samuiensis]|uniref:Peroxiredoxin n=1 Tax=Swingsia samuiensis TaxID=1293412 RepID=A0A4Y6UN30_9PROT|nr:hypothetical protein [Swingsia samuiensis]QDH17796.1 hypothetical protein E3D00_09615 [Swingsia samuiensis]